MKLRAFLALVLLQVVVSAGCATTVPNGTETAADRTTFTFDQQQASYELFSTYRMKPGDILDVLFQIRTWVEKDSFLIAVGHTLDVRFVHALELNERPGRTYEGQRVLPDGTISLPYLGPVKVTGKTVLQLKQELQERYKPILRNPELYIIVPEHEDSIKQLKADLHTSPRGLSRLVTIRPDGYVTFPMVGDIFVADRSLPEVSAELNKLYLGILPDLHCDLFLEQHAGSVVYVTGEVKNPGSFKVVKPITVLEAVTLAGGFDRAARLEEVVVIRRHEQKFVATRINLAGNLSGISKDPFFHILPDDIVLVPRTRLSKAAEVARSIGDIIFFRGWNLGFNWELRTAPEGNASLGIGTK